jgi:hypothetical protein
MKDHPIISRDYSTVRSLAGRWYYFSLEMSNGQYYRRLYAGRLGALAVDLTYLTLISHVHVDPYL